AQLQLTQVSDFPPDGTYKILATATDKAGNQSEIAQKTITIDLVNDAPMITSTAPLSVTKGNTYTYQLSASDVDVGDQLTATATTLPSWLTFDPETLILTGTPSGSQIGSSDVTIEVTDGTQSSSQTFSINVNNTIGSVVVLVDQFSDRIFDLGHQNLTLFDYGAFNTARWYDSGANGYNGYDTWEYTFEDQVGGFYQLTPDSDASFYPATFVASTTNDFDYDFIQSGSGFDPTFGSYIYDDYYVFNRFNQTSDISVNHGDWALEALLQQLDNPEKTAIIAIDLDTLNGAGSHYQQLFETSVFNVPGYGVWNGTTVEQVILNWLSINDYRFSGNPEHNDYSLSAFSISIAGAPASVEMPTLDFLASLQAPIVQAAPNITQGIYDWGSNYSDVINVGAWNKDSSGNLLISSEETFATVDILADGLISKLEWGTNFGTSFATPRVTAEITNFINDIIEILETEGTSLGEAQQDSADLDIDYSDLIASIIETIGSSVSFNINDQGTIDQYIKAVLSDDLSPSTEPNTVNTQINEEVAWGVITDIEILVPETAVV
ncbi:putative Ig domain-containing protein, partial [Rhodobacteraceae bacterium XHP0102]|nr:putative Ig domain-containing protein [Rhodobacteraceae bacterium XHP0102]